MSGLTRCMITAADVRDTRPSLQYFMIEFARWDDCSAFKTHRYCMKLVYSSSLKIHLAVCLLI